MKQVLRGKLKASGPQGSRGKKHFTFTLSPHSALPLIKAIFLSYTPFCLTDCIMFKLDRWTCTACVQCFAQIMDDLNSDNIHTERFIYFFLTVLGIICNATNPFLVSWILCFLQLTKLFPILCERRRDTRLANNHSFSIQTNYQHNNQYESVFTDAFVVGSLQ